MSFSHLAALDSAHPSRRLFLTLAAVGAGAAGLADAIPFTAGLDAVVATGALDTTSTDLADLVGRPTSSLEDSLREPVAAALASAGTGA